ALAPAVQRDALRPVDEAINFAFGDDLDTMLARERQKRHRHALLGVTGAAAQATDAVVATMHIAGTLATAQRRPAVTQFFKTVHIQARVSVPVLFADHFQ